MSGDSLLSPITGSDSLEDNDHRGNETVCESEVDFVEYSEDFDSNWRLLSVTDNAADPICKR